VELLIDTTTTGGHAMQGLVRRGLLLVPAVLTGLLPRAAAAGMPTYGLNDVASLRLQAISFFLALVLATAWLVQGLWNLSRRDHAVLPRLSYRGALGLVVILGLLLQLVLAMIAGARELMTPGAWVRAGTTYRLQGGGPEPSPETYLELARRRGLEELRRALWSYAGAHGGALPPHDFVAEIPDAVWTTVDPSGMRYIYLGGRVDQDRRLVAYEPGLFGPRRLGLYADGTVREVQAGEIR